MAGSSKRYFDFMGEDGAEQFVEWAEQYNFNLQRREIFDSPPIPLETAYEIVEKFRNLTEAEASFELFKLKHPRERVAAMIGLTDRTKKRKLGQQKKNRGASWSMDDAMADFVIEYKKSGYKTVAANTVAKNHGVNYKTILRHAEKRSLI